MEHLQEELESLLSRAVDAELDAPLYVKALTSDSRKNYWMNFQQVKPACCDVFVWIAVWRDVIRYWVLSSHEVATNRYYSQGQHRESIGEGQLHMRRDSMHEFEEYEEKSNRLEEAIRTAYGREIEARGRLG